MISKPIKEILNEFDKFLEILNANEDTKMYFTNVCEDIKLIELWRQELETGKQSIFVMGKMSTGKSTFLNFLLDNSGTGEDEIFKTSTKTETGIIQTLEHCSSKSDAYAKIIIRDIQQFKMLSIPSNIKYEFGTDFFIIPLDNKEQISFFRNNIIAKTEDTPFNTIDSIDQVNIKYPIKFFKANKIIDTPGLEAEKDADKTEKMVKTNYYGKSHIFWFLNASKRTMSDSLTLLEKEKNLLKMNFDRVHFIANMFDLMDYDDDNNPKDDDNNSKVEVIKRMSELTTLLNDTLVKIQEQELNNISLNFTSFKKPNKRFGFKNTISIIENLEEQLILEKKDTNYNNINFLTTSMKSILKKLEGFIVTDEQKNIEKTINEKFKIKEIEKKHQIIQNLKKDIFVSIDISIEKIKSIKKEDNLNTRKKYNTYFINFKKEVEESASKIENALDRIDNFGKFEKVSIQLIVIKFINDFSIKEEEGFWKKYFADSELYSKKKILMDYVLIKIDQLNELKEITVKLIEEMKVSEISKVMVNIFGLESIKKNIERNHQIINSIKYKLTKVNNLLLDDLETKISEWNPPQQNNNNLLSFLQLYSLLEEHKLVITKNS